jgi:Fe-S-cluster containining protein
MPSWTSAELALVSPSRIVAEGLLTRSMVKVVENCALGSDWAHEEGNGFTPCLRCGLCCLRRRVPITFMDARRISDGMGVAWREFENRYVDAAWHGAESFFLRQRRGACIFLKHDRGSYRASCLVHLFKPLTCREWTPSLYRPDCQAGLAKHWGLSVGPSGELRGTDDRLRDFHSFLTSQASE